MRFARSLQLIAAATCAALAVPAAADVKDGVDAWSRGDYAEAVREWRAPAENGDPDAQFNMAQAYRLGRGVERDEAQAKILYAKAAAQGHIKAADNYGLMLFQDGRRVEAMPYVTAAADRGDPRAQYLLGIAHFNGDVVEKDWVRAYAFLTLANSAGLPQAAPAIRQMDDYIPLAQRQEAQALAQSLKRESDATRAQQLAAVDLAMGGRAEAEAAPASAPAPAPEPEREPPAAVVPAISGRIPQPIERTGTPPSIASAQAAIAEASRVTGTQSPAEAGADYARPTSTPAPETPAPRQPAEAEDPAPATPPEAPEVTSSNGPWRVQLGAFSVSGNAERLWSDVSGLPALAGKKKFLVTAGGLTRLQAGGFASRSAAQSACDALKAGGRDCLVTR